jgi:hypothetical protein
MGDIRCSFSTLRDLVTVRASAPTCAALRRRAERLVSARSGSINAAYRDCAGANCPPRLPSYELSEASQEAVADLL